MKLPDNPKWRSLFQHRVIESKECWLWLDGITDAGYGCLRIKDIFIYAHRLSWELINGSILDDLQVLHTCDNPRCVNPEHLFLGTHLENMKDRDSKLRQAHGERQGRSKLTKKQVLEIRAKWATGCYSQTDLAKEYKILQDSISDIVNRRTWKHI